MRSLSGDDIGLIPSMGDDIVDEDALRSFNVKGGSSLRPLSNGGEDGGEDPPVLSDLVEGVSS